MALIFIDFQILHMAETHLLSENPSISESSGNNLKGNCVFQAWTDVHLTWNSDDHGGVDLLRLPIDMIYQPNLFLDFISS